MSGFDQRWRRLARAASRSAVPPLPPAPDGAHLWRRAAAAREAAPPGPRRLAAAIAVGLLWAAAAPAVLPAWRASRAVWADLEAGASALPASGAPALAAPAVPGELPSPALARGRLPRLPDLVLRPAGPAGSPLKEPS